MLNFISYLITDINECSDSNGGCDDDCINTIGSFFCECDSGYALQSNGKTCNGQLHVLILLDVVVKNEHVFYSVIMFVCTACLMSCHVL